MVQITATGVVWDLDGTLLNSLKIYEDVLSEIFRQHGVPIPSPEAFQRNSHAPLYELIRELTGLDGEIVQTIRDEFIESEDHHYEGPEALYYSDAVKLLRRCHAAGLQQIIITSRWHYNDKRLGSPRNLAREPPLKGMINAVVCGDDNDFHKPDARVLDDAERRLGLMRSSLIIIGDQFVDAELAHNLGAQAVLVARNKEGIHHLDRLSDEWREQVTIVQTLDDITITLLA